MAGQVRPGSPRRPPGHRGIASRARIVRESLAHGSTQKRVMHVDRRAVLSLRARRKDERQVTRRRRDPMKRGFTLLPVVAVALTALFSSLPRPAAGQACKGEGPQVGRWKTWVLSSGS